MSAITTSVVAAIAAGAAAAAENVANDAVKRAYKGLKQLIRNRYQGAADATDLVEKDPSSTPHQEILIEELNKANASADASLQEAAKKLLAEIEKLKGQPGTDALFDFKLLKLAGNMELDDIQLVGSIIRADEAHIKGDFTARGIRQRHATSKKK